MPKILMVDDEVQVLHALRRLFRREGFEVELAGGGAEALAKLQTFAPDVVLSDFRMPGMNGAELLAEVKRREPLAVRMIVSGFADRDTVDTAAHGEECRFVAKPWDDAALVQTIRALLADRALLARLHGSFAGLGEGVRAEVAQRDGAVELRLRCGGEPFGIAQALELVARFTGALGAENLAQLGALLAEHGARLSLTADVGGNPQLSLALPTVPTAAHAGTRQ